MNVPQFMGDQAVVPFAIHIALCGDLRQQGVVQLGMAGTISSRTCWGALTPTSCAIAIPTALSGLPALRVESSCLLAQAIAGGTSFGSSCCKFMETA